MKNGNKVIQDIVRGMLQSGLVDEVVAFGKGGPGGRHILPLWTSEPQDADKVVTVSYYPCSLAKLVAKYGDKGKKIGMLVRPCDARAVVELAKRQQINRDNIYLIGIECYGVVRGRDAHDEVYVFPAEMEMDGQKKPLDESFLLPSCLRCEYPLPTMADVSLRIEPEGVVSVTANTDKGKEILSSARLSSSEGAQSDISKIKERAARWQEKDFGVLKGMSSGDRLNYWLSQLDKCIKCYGCRDSCPICTCKECYLEPARLLVEGGKVRPEKLFHITRLMHVGDSCVNCGQCEMACPMHIPVSKLCHMLNKELSTLFKYEPGFDLNALPPISTIDDEDLAKTGVDLS